MNISLHKVRAENGKNPTLREKFGKLTKALLKLRVTTIHSVRRKVQRTLLSIIKDTELQK
jgi:hypothetical protein